MAKSASNVVLDALLNKIAESDQMSACSAEPLTYYEAIDPSAWQASTSYSVGDVVRPTTRNGYSYECTTGGTSGGTEPIWGTTPGGTTSDGTVVWTCRNNYALASQAMVGGDFTNADGDVSGRKVTVAQKNTVSIHTNGTATHVSQVDNATKSLLTVTTCTSQVLTAGGTVTFPAHKHEVADPV